MGICNYLEIIPIVSHHKLPGAACYSVSARHTFREHSGVEYSLIAREESTQIHSVEYRCSIVVYCTVLYCTVPLWSAEY